MLKGIPYRKRAGFSTIYSMATLHDMKTDQIVTLVEQETDYIMKEGKDFNRRQKKGVILKALSILNNPGRTVFNNPETVTFK